mgnify:CR=1 FL=1|jgi:hypothetical protein
MTTKISVSFEPIRDLLGDPELRKFKKVLAKPGPAVVAFLDALDRPDVLIGMILTPVFGVPGIVPACITLKGDKSFSAAIKGDDLLKKCLGTVTKVRAKSLGLAPTGRKGRVGYWMPGFTVGEVYEPTAEAWSVLSFAPPLPKGANILGILDQAQGGRR